MCESHIIQELVLEDSLVGKAKKTFLYKLSENGVLSYFRKVVLVSSPKDQYVPSYSARIQVCYVLYCTIAETCSQPCAAHLYCFSCSAGI